MESLYGKPDFSNIKNRIVIFIDSCFLHDCQMHFKIPQNNHEYWLKKIEYNKIRDNGVFHLFEIRMIFIHLNKTRIIKLLKILLRIHLVS